MYSATLIIDDITVSVWGETLDNIDRMYIAGDIIAETFNSKFYEQIKKDFKAKAVLVPF